MTGEVFSDPLLEWNRLNKQNAKQGLVDAAFSSVLSTSPIIDKFSVWLLAGTGATAALFITNMHEIMPFLSVVGFKVCGVLLVISALFGFFAKYKAIVCQIIHETDVATRQAIKPVLDKHFEDKEKIVTQAMARSVELEAGLDLTAVFSDLNKPFPIWVQWLMSRTQKEYADNPHAGNFKSIRRYYWQATFTFIQTIIFLAFIIAGVLYASPKTQTETENEKPPVAGIKSGKTDKAVKEGQFGKGGATQASPSVTTEPRSPEKAIKATAK